jgi:ubiquitin-protein ligase E3 C
MPLLSLMAYVDTRCGGSDWRKPTGDAASAGGGNEDDDAMDVSAPGHDDDTVQEQAFALANGIKRLEFRLAALQGRIQASEKARSADACASVGGGGKYDGMMTIIRVLTSPHIVSSLTDVVPPCPPAASTSSPPFDASLRDTLASTFNVMNAYRKTLMCSPAGAASAAAATSTPLAVSLLTTMAFGRPMHPLTRRLWTLLTTAGPLSLALLSEVVTSDAPAVPAGAPLFSTQALGSSNVGTGGHGPLVLRAAEQLGMPPGALREGVLSCLYILCAVLAHQLPGIDDEEFFDQGKLLPLDDIQALVKLLKTWLYKLYWTHPIFDGHSDFKDSTAMPSLQDLQVLIAATRLFNLLFTRNERRRFLPEDAWHFKSIARLDADAVSEVLMDSGLNVPPAAAMAMAGGDYGASSSSSSSSASSSSMAFGSSRSNALHQLRTVLSCIPQVIPFDQRVDVFQSLLRIDKERFFATDARGGGLMAAIGMQSSVRFSVNRDTIVEDAFLGLRTAGGRLKGRVQVEFVGEAGIDGGGLFKEFLDTFFKAAFDPALGLFCNTSAELLVPNSASSQSAHALCLAVSDMDGSLTYTVGPDGQPRPVLGHTHLSFFSFLGKMLGKAVYESFLVEPEFSSVFLNALLDRRNQMDDLHDLDEAMHRSLVAMKHAAARGEDASAWGLFFEVDRVRDGQVVSEELIPGGAQVPVTRDNVHKFIHLKANYKLNVETAEQSRAFLSGFRDMIPVDWMRMFGPRELQLLISGDKRAIDVADMRRHVSYAGGYADSQPYIEAFWAVVSAMTPTEQGELLQFVTSCPRQPLRGFGQLNPRICIQKVPQHAQYMPDAHTDGASAPAPLAPRLPSAATCMNLLKLPQYDTVEMLREKLLYAIKSHSGFELS